MGASSQISDNTHFHQHVSILCRKAGVRLRILQRLSSYIDEHSRMTIFRSFVLSNYCSLVWNFCEAAHTSKMERIQYRALKCIYYDVSTSYEELLACANLPTLELHRKREILVEVFKSVNNISPYFMWDLFKVKYVDYNLQNNRNVCLNHCQTKKYGLDFLNHGAQANYRTCYQMKWMNIKLGNYKASIRNGMNRCGVCVQ